MVLLSESCQHGKYGIDCIECYRLAYHDLVQSHEDLKVELKQKDLQISELKEELDDYRGAFAAVGLTTATPRQSLVDLISGHEAHHQEHHRKETALETGMHNEEQRAKLLTEDAANLRAFLEGQEDKAEDLQTKLTAADRLNGKMRQLLQKVKDTYFFTEVRFQGTLMEDSFVKVCKFLDSQQT